MPPGIRMSEGVECVGLVKVGGKCLVSQINPFISGREDVEFRQKMTA